MCLLGLPILGLKALSRTPAIMALVVLLLSVVVLVAITLIQIHQKEVLLPGLKVSVKGLALKGRNGLQYQLFYSHELEDKKTLSPVSSCSQGGWCKTQGRRSGCVGFVMPEATDGEW